MMPETSWTLIRAAGEGEADRQAEFVRRYSSPLRAFLHARWRDSALASAVDDACQEVFVECFRSGGIIERAGGLDIQSFRGFLLGVARHVAQRLERLAVGKKEEQPETAFLTAQADPAALDPQQAFELQWARTMVAHALERVVRSDSEEGPRLSELLEMRFQKGLPVREIARVWGCPPEIVHRLYEKARRRFRLCLRETVEIHDPGSKQHVELECRRLIESLS